MSNSKDAGLLAPKQPAGHRRVKSLVREIDGKQEVIPAAELSPPLPKPNGHTRRAASVSYTTSNTGNGSFNYSPTKPISPISVSKSMNFIEPSTSPTGIKRRGSSVTSLLPTVEAATNETGLTELQEEEEDVFLPLSPANTTPYSVKSNGTTPPPSAGPRAGEHARKNSKIHERNLSAFFPRPGAVGTGYGDVYQDINSTEKAGAVTDIPSAVEALKREDRRRGHHHKHSVSHQFFSFMDPADPNSTEKNSTYALSTPSRIPSTPYSNNTTPPTPSLNRSSSAAYPSLAAQSFRSNYSHLPAIVRIFLYSILYLPLETQIALALSFAQILLGATLWITGQTRESLAVTGLGYLVVFDGMGGLSGVLIEGGKGIESLWLVYGMRQSDSGVRMPFGSHRLITLSHFSQAIYLLFSAVYVLKESVEHVLMLHGPNEAEGGHGSGHGGMGHGEGLSSSVSSGSDGISLPVALLVIAALFSIVSAVAFRNHQKLSAAVGPSRLARATSKSSSPGPLGLVLNPFTSTILVFSIGLAVSAFTIPALQLAPMDKVVALLESLAMFYIAYPAVASTGEVLLQTAPPPSASQMTSVTTGLRELEGHPLVVSIAPPHIWQLTPHPLTPPASPPAYSTVSRRSNSLKDSGATPLVATLQVKVKNDATDKDILELTKFCQDRCSGALNGAEEIGGELTVEIKRASTQAKVSFYSAGETNEGKSHHGHDHSNHSHSH